MFNLCLCSAATIQYSQLKFGHMHLCGINFKCFSPHCCKCNSFGCTAAIRCGNACHGPPSDSFYSGSEHSQFNSPRLVKREAGFPNPRRALIGSNQLWRVNDSPYYREYPWLPRLVCAQRVDTVKQSGPWSSLGTWVCAEDGDHETAETVKHYRSSLGNHGYYEFTLVTVHLLLWWNQA